MVIFYYVILSMYIDPFPPLFICVKHICNVVTVTLIHKVTTDIFSLPFNGLHSWFRFSTDFDRFMGNKTGAACGTAHVYFSGTLDVDLGFYESLYCPDFSFKCCFPVCSMFVFASSFLLSV